MDDPMFWKIVFEDQNKGTAYFIYFRMPLPARSSPSAWTASQTKTINLAIWSTTVAGRSCSTQQLWQQLAATVAVLPAAPARPHPRPQSHAQVLHLDRCLRPRSTLADTRRSCVDLTRKTVLASTARNASSLTDSKSWGQSTDIPSTRPTSVKRTTRLDSAPTDRVVISSTAWKNWQPEPPTALDKGTLPFPTDLHPFVQLRPLRRPRPPQPTKLPLPLLPFDNCPSTLQNVCPLHLVSDPDQQDDLLKVWALLVWTVLGHLEPAVQAVWVPACSQIWKMEMIHYRDSQYSADCPIKNNKSPFIF